MATGHAYVRRTAKTFPETIEAVERSVRSYGFSVFHKHDIGSRVSAKGFPIRPLVILEVGPAETCSAHEMALLLPCRINVYEEEGQTVVAALRPSVFRALYADERSGVAIDDIERAIAHILDDSTV